ncbi:MAG: bifunctional lysylphosphatidylglycerol flippase/synthetase MprF [Gemmatimonadetes bacterium]|nr:bifunctional lysylphosphatidylglycerol flippase/synthetase MprF [Gemmatimonadota bacterium]
MALFALAFWSLHRELRGLTWLEVRSDLAGIPAGTMGAALLLTLASFLVLTRYDALALRYAGVRLPPARVAFASAIGYAFSQGLGFPLLTGAPVRYRLYSSWGLTAADVGRVVAFYSSGFWIGFAAAAGAAFIAFPVTPPPWVPLPGDSLRVLGGMLLGALALLLLWASWGRGSIRLGPLTFPVPGPGLVMAQMGLGLLDWSVASLVLWTLLPEGHALGFGHFLSVFLLAQCVGVISHVPGGLGVFEAVFLTFLPRGPEHTRILASLFAFRLVYYLVPLFVAAAVLTVRELHARRGTLAGPTSQAARAASQLVPLASAAVAFVLGGALLLSGAIPVPAGRLRTLAPLLPLPLFELSHFVGSLLGAVLLVVARGLQRRLDGAYHVALAALIGGALLALGRDLHLVSTLVFGGAAWALFSSRREFYRRASMLDEPFTRSWVLAIGAVLAATVWLGLFAFKHVEYAHDLWWHFALEDDAPRFLRAMVGVSGGLALFVTARMLRPAPAVAGAPTAEQLDQAARLVNASAHADANLVFLGDKQILFSDSGRAFLMWAVSGSSWVVMGDPVGDPTEFETLAWTLRERADRAGGHLVFYEVGPAWLPLYIDLGLVFYKLGEDARVPLTDFTLDGKARAPLRSALRRLEREGGSFEVVPVAGLDPLLPRLRAISDDWLATKHVREKRFSLGWFNERYLRRFPCAVVRVGDDVVAFATLWTGSAREELTVDLMRYGSDAPKGVMDALFTHLLVWGAEQGYRWFSLGMAPFSGMEGHRLAPLWQKTGAALYRYGEYFYNFQGLRDYKEKFGPVWEPRYLAAPPGLAIAGVLADVTVLISGSLRGAVMR